MASAFTISPPSRSATASASADFPVPVGPTIAMGRMALRLPDAGEVADAVGRSAVELLGRPRRRFGEPGQHLVGHPADDRRRGSRVRAATSPAASASSSARLHGDRVGVVAAGRGRRSGCARRRRRRARRPGRRPRRSRRAAGGRGPAPRRRRGRRRTPAPRRCACGLTCPRTQPAINAHSGSSSRDVGRAGRQRDPHVDAVAGERADPLRDPPRRRRARPRRRSTAAAATPRPHEHRVPQVGELRGGGASQFGDHDGCRRDDRDGAQHATKLVPQRGGARVGRRPPRHGPVRPSRPPSPPPRRSASANRRRPAAASRRARRCRAPTPTTGSVTVIVGSDAVSEPARNDDCCHAVPAMATTAHA